MLLHHRRSTMKMKITSSSSQQMVAATLPDDCWETIFKFIINDDDNHNGRYLNSLSLVSRQFLSITHCLLFTLLVCNSKDLRHVFERFTNLNSLNFSGFCIDWDKLLREISGSPLKKLTSLNLPNHRIIPANGLRVFSQKIKTLTSLICANIELFKSSDLFLIAECFPLLQELVLSCTHVVNNKASYFDGVEALSLALIKLRKVNLSGIPINNKSLFHLFNNCKYLEEVIIFRCDEITNDGIASALRERPALRSLSFSIASNHPEYGQIFSSSHFIDSLVSLKGLTCLVLNSLNISDELLYSIAREGLPLVKLSLQFCIDYGYAGIFGLLSKCQRIQHLNLRFAIFLNDQHVVQLSSFLGDLVSINLCYCPKLTESALFALAKNCSSLSEIKMERIGSNIAGNSDNLVDFGVYPQLKSLFLGDNSWLTDENIIMFASIFLNLQLLDLNYCHYLSEGICKVLRKCCKLRYLNLASCSRMKLLGLNFVVPNLEVLNLSNTKVDDETLYVISKNCPGLLQLLLLYCDGVTEKGVKHVVKNLPQLRGRVVKA